MGKSINFITYIPIMIIVFVLGYWVYRTNKKRIVNRLFFLICLCVAFWTLTLVVTDTTNIYFYAYWGSQFAIIGPLFLGPSFFLFSMNFPYGKKIISKTKIFFFFLPSIIALFFFPTRYNVEYVIMRDWGTEVIPGLLYPVLFVIMLFYFTWGIVNLYKKYKIEVGLQRLQIVYVTLGISISTFLAITTNLVLVVLGISKYSILGPAVFLVFIGLTAYAIVHYRLMDIRVIIRRSVAFAFLVATITAIYALIAYFASLFLQRLIGVQSIFFNGVITGFLVTIGFEPLKKKLAEVTDKYLFKGQYRPQEILGEISDKLSTNLDLNVLAGYLTRRLAEIFKVEFVSLFLIDEKSGLCQRAAVFGKTRGELEQIDKNSFDKIYKYLKSLNKEKDIFTREEIKVLNEQHKSQVLNLYSRLLDQYAVNLVAPLYVREKLLGILFLGDKQEDEVFFQDDIKILKVIAGQAAVAMQNARLYEEQRHFSSRLKHEVELATEELKTANAKLKKLDKAKSDFVSIASHQLRTPLTSIRGYNSMLLSGDFAPVPDNLIRPLNIVDKSIARLSALIDDLLIISRLESNRMEYDFSQEDLKNVLKDVGAKIKPLALAKKLEFICRLPDQKMPLITIDKQQIENVLFNLAENAVKYTSRGFVKIELEKKEESLIVSVADSGIGVDKSDQDKLFKKFSRIEGASLTMSEGTGLGLYIAKNILKQHNAEIWVESPGKDKGATFIIEFKIENNLGVKKSQMTNNKKQITK